jgi:hypothetical protein
MTRILWRAGVTMRVFPSAILLFASSSLQAQGLPTPVDTSYVEYGESWIALPLGVGLRVPSYDRVDGLSLPWGPEISLADEHIRIDPTVTYRSHIGKFDPFVTANLRTTSGILLDLAGGRGTFTNDDWIRSDIVNSLAALFVGSDSRNYFRADRGWAILSKEIGWPDLTITPGIGGRLENDWSTGVPVAHTNAPWSMFGKTKRLKMGRLNPSIDDGHIASGLGRLLAEYESDGVKASFAGLIEHAFDTPPIFSIEGRDLSGDFTQFTLHGTVGFPTFRTQRFDFRGHMVATSGDFVPAQRYAYLGGAGTLATVDLLALGGDRLFFVTGEYSVPIERIQLPVIGSPVVSLIYSAGSAGVGELPDFIQNIGVGLGVKLIKAEYHVDPNYKKTSFTHKSAFAVSLSLDF